ncbi:MAG TPA: CapA family protein [Ktedonobacterales bacterium]|nr:CapA family protein [Ktedonobacterales bacterium]
MAKTFNRLRRFRRARHMAAPPGGWRISRRELLATAAALTLAGCAPTSAVHHPTPTSTPFALKRPATLYADGTVPPSLRDAAIQYCAGVAGIPGATAAASLDANPDLVLSFGQLPAGYSGAAIGPSPITALTHPRVPVDGVTSAQLSDLISGAIGDWSSAGSPYSLPVHVLALAGLPVPPGLRTATSARTVATLAALLDAVRAQPGSLALAPLEAADWSVRNLGVGGAYPAQGRGMSSPPLPPYTLLIGVSPALVKQGLDPKRLAPTLALALAASVPVLDMAVAGDIMLGRGVNNQMLAHGDYRYPYRLIQAELESADLRIANLECTVSDLVPVPADPSTFSFVTSRKAIDGLTWAGLNVVTVANNHADGPSMAAFLDMIANLRAHGIAVCGGGHTLDEARRPATARAKGLRVAILGYDGISPQGPFATGSSPGIAPIDLSTLAYDLAAARQQADLVIPYFHWGIEYTKDPTSDQQRTAHAAVDAGADMVLGVHPHWVQGIERYKGRLIIYSLGNFIFDQDWSRPTMEGMLLHLYWRGTTLAGVRFVPTLDVSRCQPRPLSPADAVGVFSRMWSGTDMLASGQYGPEPE